MTHATGEGALLRYAPRPPPVPFELISRHGHNFVRFLRPVDESAPPALPAASARLHAMRSADASTAPMCASADASHRSAAAVPAAASHARICTPHHALLPAPGPPELFDGPLDGWCASTPPQAEHARASASQRSAEHTQRAVGEARVAGTRAAVAPPERSCTDALMAAAAARPASQPSAGPAPKKPRALSVGTAGAAEPDAPLMSAAALREAEVSGWPAQQAVVLRVHVAPPSAGGGASGASDGALLGVSLFAHSTAGADGRGGGSMQAFLALGVASVAEHAPGDAAGLVARSWALVRDVLLGGAMKLWPACQAGMRALLSSEGLRPALPAHALDTRSVLDPLVLGWLLDPDHATDSLAELWRRHCPSSAATAPAAPAGAEPTCADVWQMCDLLYAQLLASRAGDARLVRGIVAREMACAPLLASLELRGMCLDARSLAAAAASADARLHEHTARARALARSKELNLASPSQLAVVLYNEFRLAPPGARAAGGRAAPPRSTGEPQLRALAESLRAQLAAAAPPAGGEDERSRQLAFVETVLAFRTCAKLKSTYIDPLVAFAEAETVGGGGGVTRLRSRWSAIGVATGRLASSNPNVQNVSAIVYELGDGAGPLSVRDAFVAPTAGGALAAFDYAQLEVRLLAHLSRDATLLRELGAGGDLFRSIGARVLGKRCAADVSDTERGTVKRLIYGLLYGLGNERLAAELHVTPASAARLREDVLRRFGSLRAFIESVKAGARAHGFVTTRGGRRRLLPAVRSASAEERARAERQCLNSVIQGTAADVVKSAMVLAERALREAALCGRVRLVAQIHDELLVELDCAADLQRAAPLVLDAMERVTLDGPDAALHLGARLPVTVRAGATWGQLARLQP